MRTADHLQHALLDYQCALEQAEAHLNELNVFPIADSDTGSNVKGTILAIVSSLSSDRDLSVEEVANRVSAAALASSRGNSGLILGQFLSGFTSALVEDPWPEEWLEALQAGAEKARAAVAKPEEGTILTVADKAATAVGDDVPALLLSAARLADEAVVQTQFQLPVLTERGVVDAGGLALALFLQSLSAVLANEPEFTIADKMVSPRRRSGDALAGAGNGLGTLAATVQGYELQFNCRVSDCGGVDALKELLSGLGTDVSVGSAGGILVAHVHASDIGPVVEGILGLAPFNIQIEALLVADVENDHG